MTGYESKKAMAQDKLEQWDTPSEAFNEWWNGEYDDSTNPFTKHSLAYWAWAGWQAALAQPAQEQKYEKRIAPYSTTLSMLLNTAPPQRQPLTDEEIADYLGDEYHTMTAEELRYFRLAEAAHGIKENT